MSIGGFYSLHVSPCKATRNKESEATILPAPFSARGASPVADAEDAVADVVQRGEVGGGGGLQVQQRVNKQLKVNKQLTSSRDLRGRGDGGGGGRGVEGGGVGRGVPALAPLFQPRAPPLHLEAQVAGRLGKLKRIEIMFY